MMGGSGSSGSTTVSKGNKQKNGWKKIIFVRVLVFDEKNRIGKPLVRIRESGFVVNVTESTTLEPMEAVAFKPIPGIWTDLFLVGDSLPYLIRSLTHFLQLCMVEFIACSQCGGSGMFIPDPGCRILIFTHPGSRIPDPKTATKERDEKNLMSYLPCSHKFHKIVHYFSFEVLKKKIWVNFQRIIELFTQKIVT